MPLKSGAAPSLVGRRDLLTLGTAGCLGLAGGAGLLAGARSCWPPRGERVGALLRAGSPDEYREGQVDARLLADHDVWVMRQATGFVALHARCTHMGCKLRQRPGGGFHCACHGSTFAPDGQVLGGPAPRAMERLQLGLSPAGEILVDPRRRYLQERGQWRAPGAYLPYPPGRDR